MLELTVKQNRMGPVLGRHPWVFSQALTGIPDAIPSGEPVKLVNQRGDFLALGYFNSYSQITVRIWGYEENERVNEEFFVRRIERAYGVRKRYLAGDSTNAFRIINGESDLLPGLIVDKYGDYLVLQLHTRGIESWKKEILAALEKTLQPAGIYERSDVAVRKRDDLTPSTGLLAGSVPDLITIFENGLKFLVDVRHGQKTGFFLDQRDKRKAFMGYTNGASVLNCFSYTGGFSVYALAGGAKAVVNVDTSQAALDLAKENIALNGFDTERCRFVAADVKTFLRNIADHYDCIVLDPPAFIKDRRKKQEGLAGYRTINELALQVLQEKDILLTCSCSAHLAMEEFRYLLSEAGGKTGKTLSILETYTHGIDHPQLVPFTEGAYLKTFFLTVR